jgi:hypothetical protein
MAHTIRPREARAKLINYSIQYDLYGEKPTAPEGQHFRRSVDTWRSMVALCEDLAPEESKPCSDWYGSDPGHGLNAEQSITLAEKLEWLLVSGKVSAYDKQFVDFRLTCSPETIWEFVAFLRACGSFEISED